MAALSGDAQVSVARVRGCAAWEAVADIARRVVADQFGIGGGPERAVPPRLDPVVSPGSRDPRGADLEPGSRQAARPMRHPQPLRRGNQRRGHDSACDTRPRPPNARHHRGHRSRARPRVHAAGSPSVAESRSARQSPRSRSRQRPATRSGPAGRGPPVQWRHAADGRGRRGHHHHATPESEQADSSCPGTSPIKRKDILDLQHSNRPGRRRRDGTLPSLWYTQPGGEWSGDE